MKTLSTLVEEMLKAHKGGREFFDNLDEQLRNKNWFQSLHQVFLNSCFYDHGNSGGGSCFIVSGRFGILFHNWLKHEYSSNRKVFIVSGGLRKAKEIDELNLLMPTIKGKKFVFLDDSLHSGNTRDVIKNHIEDLGGIFEHTFVIYDGSKENDANVTSMYRYYDQEDKTKKPIGFQNKMGSHGR